MLLKHFTLKCFYIIFCINKISVLEEKLIPVVSLLTLYMATLSLTLLNCASTVENPHTTFSSSFSTLARSKSKFLNRFSVYFIQFLFLSLFH